MSAYEKVLLARAKDRPTGLSYIENIFEDFIELHGDRRFADDPAIVGGIATLKGQPVTVIAIDKGKDMRERVQPQLWRSQPRGLPQGPAPDAPGGEIPPAGGVLCGHLRGLLRHGRRGAGPGAGHRREPAGACPA